MAKPLRKRQENLERRQKRETTVPSEKLASRKSPGSMSGRKS